MSHHYGKAAIEFCRSLYLKYGGRNFAAIEAEMQRRYPKWRKQNLSRKGTQCWITKYGFDRSLEVHLQTLAVQHAETDGEKQFKQLVTVRDQLFGMVVKQPGDKELVWQFRDVCREVTTMLARLDAGSKDATAFAASWETLLDILHEFNPDLAIRLLGLQDEILKRVKARHAATHPQPERI
jgi:hypothetical protein